MWICVDQDSDLQHCYLTQRGLSKSGYVHCRCLEPDPVVKFALILKKLSNMNRKKQIKHFFTFFSQMTVLCSN
jgi:hypothetical protein